MFVISIVVVSNVMNLHYTTKYYILFIITKICLCARHLCQVSHAAPALALFAEAARPADPVYLLYAIIYSLLLYIQTAKLVCNFFWLAWSK